MVKTEDAGLTKIDVTGVTGVTQADRFLATRYTQGGRIVYSVDVPLDLIPQIIPVPDPTRPTPGNRRVNERHAKDFGSYVTNTPEWVAPPLLIRDPDVCQFDKQLEVGGMEIGILSIPRTASARAAIKIIDGQHRVLGLDIAIRDLDVKIADSMEQIARSGETEALMAQLKELQTKRSRFATESMTLTIYRETQPQRYEQMFFDVADNALGINQAVKVRFDSRKVVNRTIDEVAKHALLRGRVDMEQDRVTKANPNLLGAKHVADIVRTVKVGIAGRVGKRLEDELDEGALVEETNTFLEALVDGFPDLARVADGDVSPEQLRSSSLLGSITMLRVLAGVYHDLRASGVEVDDITDFFMKLSRHTGGPVRTGDIWFTTDAKQDFTEGAYGPNARRQNLAHLVDVIVAWYETPPVGL